MKGKVIIVSADEFVYSPLSLEKDHLHSASINSTRPEPRQETQEPALQSFILYPIIEVLVRQSSVLKPLFDLFRHPRIRAVVKTFKTHTLCIASKASNNPSFPLKLKVCKSLLAVVDLRRKCKGSSAQPHGASLQRLAMLFDMRVSFQIVKLQLPGARGNLSDAHKRRSKACQSRGTSGF